MQWLTEETGWLLPEEEPLLSGHPTPEKMVRLGAGLANAAPRCLIGCDGSSYARACAVQIGGAVAAAGGEAILVPDCTAGELGTASLHAAGDVLLHCADSGQRLFARGLLPLTRSQETVIATGIAEARWGSPTDYGQITDGSALRAYYPERIAERMPAELPFQIEIESSAERLREILTPLMPHGHGERWTLRLSGDGRRASVYSERCGWFFYEKLLLMLCAAYLENGEDVALPYWVPQIAEEMARTAGRRILRYASRPDGADADARALALSQGFTLDGALLCADFLRICAGREQDPLRWAKKLPACHTVRRVMPADRAAKAAARCSTWRHSTETPEGLRAGDHRGSVLLHPARSGKTFTVLIEANNMELASEIAGDLFS